MILFFISLIFSVAEGSIYQTVGTRYKEVGQSVVIKNMPAYRTQDGLGLCYAAATTTLLDHFYCKEKKIDCKSRSNDERISLLSVAGHNSYLGDEIHVGGRPAKILNNIKNKILNNKKPFILKEKCAPYESLMLEHYAYRDRNGMAQTAREQAAGWYFLKNIFDNKYKNRDRNTLACTIKEKLKINKSLESIIKTLDAFIFENFVYQVLIDKGCLSQESSYIDIPLFENKNYPDHDKEKSVNYTLGIEKLNNLLLNKIPVQVNICANYVVEGETAKKNEIMGDACSGHAVVVSGMKKVCRNKNDCKTLIKIHNSYGKDWQDNHNEGWVDAEPILKASITGDFRNSFNWIQPVGKTLENFKVRRKPKRTKLKNKKYIAPALIKGRQCQGTAYA